MIIAAADKKRPVAVHVEWPQEIDTSKSTQLPAEFPTAKVKTRGTNLLQKPEDFDVTENTVDTQSPTIMKVKGETVRVLSRLFPITPEEHAAKPLDWKSFVGAMGDAGFPVIQSGGSALTFIKEGEGRIVFHKPHPVAKVDQVMLQSWGKRLTKWFGWERGSFAINAA